MCTHQRRKSRYDASLWVERDRNGIIREGCTLVPAFFSWMTAVRSEILKGRVREIMDHVSAWARLLTLLCKVWKPLPFVVRCSEQTKSTSSCGEWRARRRLSPEGLLSCETLLAAVRAKAYRGKIPCVTAILVVGSEFSRERACGDKTKGVMVWCGIWERRKRKWGDGIQGSYA